jgi:hypothetical protein
LGKNPKLKIIARKMHRATIIHTVSKIMKKLRRRSKHSQRALGQMWETTNGKMLRSKRKKLRSLAMI